jgi:hypothetical protein
MTFMNHTSVRFLCLLASVGLMTACSTSTPLQPSSATSAGTASGTITFSSSAPQPVSPADASQLAFAAQPFTLVVANALSTAPDAPTYTFEVATDAGFANIVATKAGVTQAAGAQTSAAIGGLPASSKLFWRARTVSTGQAGPAGKVRSFTIGAQVVLQTPVPISPAQNGVATGTAALTVRNVGRTGPAGPISYKFDVADSAAFSHIVFTTTVAEQGGAGGQTTAAVTAPLTNNATYFWRVQALDSTNFVTTAFSSALSFKFTSFDMHQAIIWDNPPDLASWAETATITSIDMSTFILVDHSKRTGPDKWPESGFGGGGIQYTLGMCFNLSGQWHCSAAIQFWDGRELEAGGLASDVGINWFYDSRWGPMAGHQPAPGELVGIFVAQGNLRDSGNTSVKERSNVVLIPFGSTYSAGASAGQVRLR